MPDISMCPNPKCRKRFRCYRFMAVPDDWQSYMSFVPTRTGKCHGYLKLNKGDKVGRMNRTARSVIT